LLEFICHPKLGGPYFVGHADVLVLMVDPMIEIDGDATRIADDGLVRRLLELRAVDRLISSSSEQAISAVRIKALFNLAFNRVGESPARALEIACDFVLDLLLPRRDYRIEQTPQQPGPR
jgi:hypothetical protein